MLATPNRSIGIPAAMRIAWLLPLFLLLPCGASLGADAGIPRYWLKVGQELTYETTSEVTTPDGQKAVNEATWQVWVVKQNADGSWRLVLRYASTYQPTAGIAPVGVKDAAGKLAPPKPPASAKQPMPKPSATKAPANKAQSGKTAGAKSKGKADATAPVANPPSAGSTPLVNAGEQVTFAYCDLSPDGTVAPNPTLGYQFEVRQLLPKLPKTEKELQDGWVTLDRPTQVGFRYRVEAQPAEDDDEPKWTIVATRQSPVDDIYLCRTQTIFYFDSDRGLVERLESRLEQTYGANATAVAKTRLLGVEQFDDAWCQKLDEEMGHYFAVQRRYQSLLKEAERNSSDAETLLIEAGALLQKAADDMTLPLVKEDLGKQVARHGAMIGLTARLARDRADYIDQPAPTWQAKDLEGKLLALREYKGKVVVLHFWRRGDVWSLRVLPQVEQLAEQFTEQPVVVLGMNTDENDEDASFVTDKLGLAFPIVRANKFAEKYNATGSVVFVIDQKGIVRDIYMGYSPTLREDVAGVITGLLSDGEK